ncbi:hypothetical protein CYK37_11060 [Mesorhizobium loti]|nr:hypothetical protein CYK37_11060 [Mesorhizobium loti]
MHRNIIRGGRDDEVFFEPGLERQRLFDLVTNLILCEGMAITFQLALDSHVTLRVAVAKSEEVDAILTLSPTAIALDIWVAQKTAPKNDRCTFKGLLV